MNMTTLMLMMMMMGGRGSSMMMPLLMLMMMGGLGNGESGGIGPVNLQNILMAKAVGKTGSLLLSGPQGLMDYQMANMLMPTKRRRTRTRVVYRNRRYPRRRWY